FTEWHERINDLGSSPRFHSLDLSTTTIQIADHIAHKILGNHNLHLHDRLKQHRIGSLTGIEKSHRPGDFKCHFIGVDVRNDPSITVTRTSRMGYPAITPESSRSFTPFSIAGMNSLGIEPPTVLLIKSRPLPDSAGSTVNTTCPYWPRPPVCLMYFDSASAFLRIVSRKATSGFPTLASTLNSRNMRSTMISRCSSPIPAMMVCAVSSSVFTRNEGSSCANF